MGEEWERLRGERGGEMSRLAGKTTMTTTKHNGSRRGVRSYLLRTSRAILYRHIPIPSLSALNPQLHPPKKLKFKPTSKLTAITIGQLIIIIGYIILVCLTVFDKSELKTNANRPGESARVYPPLRPPTITFHLE